MAKVGKVANTIAERSAAKTSSPPRVRKFRDHRRAAGSRAVTVWMMPEDIERLHELARRFNFPRLGIVVASAVGEVWRRVTCNEAR